MRRRLVFTRTFSCFPGVVRRCIRSRLWWRTSCTRYASRQENATAEMGVMRRGFRALLHISGTYSNREWRVDAVFAPKRYLARLCFRGLLLGQSWHRTDPTWLSTLGAQPEVCVCVGGERSNSPIHRTTVLYISPIR